MKIKCHLLAFGSNDVREINVSDDKAQNSDLNALLELAYAYGQNDLHPQQKRSVSVGDVVELHGTFFVCMNSGWKAINKNDLEKLKAMDAAERALQFLY